MISSDLLFRVLSRLGLPQRTEPGLDGLNRIYAAFSGAVPNDNIQKRIWLAGNRATPVTGGDPSEFLENWLAHGTGGTCFAANGALCALLAAAGYDAQRFLGSVLMEGLEHDGNHGTVVVRVDGIEYLVDAQLAAFKVLPLKAGQPASTGNGIHDISAEPTDEGFDISWYPGANRETPLVMRPDLERGPVGHDVFLRQYALSALPDRKRSPFNEALFVGRHFPDRIVMVGRYNRTEVSADNVVTRRVLTHDERRDILVDELGMSPEIVNAVPPDEDERP